MTELYQRYPILIRALKFINLTNPSNQCPYHGIDHLFTVFEFAANHCDHAEHKLELLIAALFHDYAHKGAMGGDHENILKACDGVRKFHSDNKEFDVNYVIFLICCTEYPYVVEESDLTEEAKILRDADMSYLFQNLSIVKLYSGLRKEFNYTFKQFTDMQETFFNGLKFYDPYTQMEWTIARKERLKELKLILEN